MLADVAGQLARDEALVGQLRAEIAELAPGAEQPHSRRRARAWPSARQPPRRSCTSGRSAGKASIASSAAPTRPPRSSGRASSSSMTSCDASARSAIASRSNATSWWARALPSALGEFELAEQSAREASEGVLRSLQETLSGLQELRAGQQQLERELEQARNARDAARAELVSLDALQKAALGEADREAGRWLAATGLAGRPRVTAQLEVEGGWERGVESVLGEALEAVHVESHRRGGESHRRAGGWHVMLVEGWRAGRHRAGTLQRACVVRRRCCAGWSASAPCDYACRGARAPRSAWLTDESLVTPEGVWVGRDWLRVARGGDPHAGVIEREHRIRGLRGPTGRPGAGGRGHRRTAAGGQGPPRRSRGAARWAAAAHPVSARRTFRGAQRARSRAGPKPARRSAAGANPARERRVAGREPSHPGGAGARAPGARRGHRPS